MSLFYQYIYFIAFCIINVYCIMCVLLTSFQFYFFLLTILHNGMWKHLLWLSIYLHITLGQHKIISLLLPFKIKVKIQVIYKEILYKDALVIPYLLFYFVYLFSVRCQSHFRFHNIDYFFSFQLNIRMLC